MKVAKSTVCNQKDEAHCCVGLAESAAQAGLAMTDLLQASPNTETRIAQECLRLLASLLRVCSDWAPTTTQLRFLVTWSLSNIEETASNVAAFNLLRAIITRKLVIPEIYDVMSKVEELMVKSQVNAYSSPCVASTTSACCYIVFTRSVSFSKCWCL